ncbi:MAG: FAD-dependent oxidoreductase [Dehalococcoidia bacterium]|nr:FAD-dependent oxidoreductase [Dehalococcoidia bacterium]
MSNKGKLFEPGMIGQMELKNRIVMAPMGNGLVDMDGRLSQRQIDFYLARAKGGVGLIITCAARTRQIEQLGFAPLVDTLMIDNKIYAGRLNELAEAVHDYGAKVAVQVLPGRGRIVRNDVLKKIGAVAPSPVPVFGDPGVIARELTVEEIQRLVQAFQFGAEMVRSAGIDAIEINSHEGLLSDQFLTALWNKRTDKYGGDLENRLRFLLEVIQSIKKGAGADFPVMVKFGLTHYLEGGRTVEEGLEIARRLEAAGVHALEIDAGCRETQYWTIPSPYQPPGCLVNLAEKVKMVVKIPVITVGKLGNPLLAERVLQEGKADFIGLARPLLAEPEWANKVREGRLEDIRPCLGDHDGCIGRTHAGLSISCTVNPACGMERELNLTPADIKKSVLVIGGGPAGMEAARVAAARGHKVALWERDNSLGGNLASASVPEFKKEYRSLTNYLATQIGKLGVDVRLGTEATPESIQKMKPDVVFVATGSTPVIPDIPGADKEKVCTAVDVLLGTKKAGKSVVVIGNGSVGCETALFLAQNGKRVTIISRRSSVEVVDKIAGDMFVYNRMHLIKLLDEAKVRILAGITVSAVSEEGLIVADKDGNETTLEADTVVLAVGMKRSENLARALADKVPQVYVIGDCVEPRKVINAIREAYRAARLV